MGRKKGDLNMITRKTIEDEKSRMAKRKMMFQFHKPALPVDASRGTMEGNAIICDSQTQENDSHGEMIGQTLESTQASTGFNGYTKEMVDPEGQHTINLEKGKSTMDADQESGIPTRTTQDSTSSAHGKRYDANN